MRKRKAVFGPRSQINSMVYNNLANNLEISCVISGTTSRKGRSKFLNECKVLKRFFDIEFAFPYSKININEKNGEAEILLCKLRDEELDGVVCFFDTMHKWEISNLKLKFPSLKFSVDIEECLVSVVRKPDK